MSLLVFGALHWDVVVRADRLPRIDETLRGREVDYRFGGKGGNQAVAAAQAGASVSFAGRVGADEPGRHMRAILEQEGIGLGHLQTGAGASGMSVAIVTEGGDYGAVIVSGENHAFDFDAFAVPEECRMVLAQNEMAAGSLERMRALAHDTGAEFWVNLAPVGKVDVAALRPDVLVVNEIEARDLVGGGAPTEVADRLHDLANSANTVVTLGGEGVVMKLRDGGSFHAAANPVTVVSTHGAGDTFVGTLAAERLAGRDWTQAIGAAQSAAARLISQRR